MGRGIAPVGWRAATATAVAALALLLAPVACSDAGDADRSRSASIGSTAGTEAGEGSDEDESPAGSTTDPAGVDGREVTVTSITDGDTLRAGEERVRLIGIDAPEVDRVECGAAAATAALGRLVPVGTRVVLVADEEPTDRYGRTLAYVHRAADGLDVNLALARQGYVTPLVVPPNDSRADQIDTAVREAVAAGRGLWDGTCPPPAELGGPTPPTTTPTPATAAPSTGSVTTHGREGCDPSYPTVCIPPPPPDLDCADIPHRRFPVLPPDPHRFDGGGDGLGCER